MRLARAFLTAILKGSTPKSAPYPQFFLLRTSISLFLVFAPVVNISLKKGHEMRSLFLKNRVKSRERLDRPEVSYVDL